VVTLHFRPDGAGDLDPTPENVVALAARTQQIAIEKVAGIHRITRMTSMLAVNAAIEASRAGAAGGSFKVLADEMKSLSGAVEHLAGEMQGEVAASLAALEALGARMSEEVRGQRLVDLALNAIEIMDRNLYERTCDVRWWATDAAVVACLEDGSAAACARAAERLGVILESYTVYLDLWIADAEGRVVASGRPDRYRNAQGTSVRDRTWFREAMASASGADYAVADIAPEPGLGQATVATYSSAIRTGGNRHGRVLGVLGIHFDWVAQSQAVVDGVRLTEAEAARTRVYLVDSRQRVIAASRARDEARRSVPAEAVPGRSGIWQDGTGTLWAHHRTPGYETYEGLGWSGVIEQRPDPRARR
jgi:hypothetical protein